VEYFFATAIGGGVECSPCMGELDPIWEIQEDYPSQLLYSIPLFRELQGLQVRAQQKVREASKSTQVRLCPRMRSSPATQEPGAGPATPAATPAAATRTLGQF